jgi:dTDP-glucose 4,6-dehydratase
MKLLITGGAGFIGSNFVCHILKEHPDYEVVDLDALTYAGDLDNLKEVMDNPRHKFVHGQIEDSELVDRLMEGIDAVVHFAAESHVDRSIVDPQAFLRTNILGTQVLLDAARKHGVERYYQISTDEVYGDVELDSAEVFTETSPLEPNSPYAASKTSGDLLVQSYYRTYKLPILISRCSNNYGRHQHPEKFMPTVILSAHRDKPIPVYGTGQYARDWIHVLDHCRAIDLVLHKGKDGETYNIGGDNEWINLDLAKKILHTMGKPESLIEFVTDRPGHDRRYAIDSTKIKRELGWQLQMPFDAGLQGTIDYYVSRYK